MKVGGNSQILYQQCWVLRWPIGSASASHQCGLGSNPGWGSDPGAVSEKGLSSPVRATLCPWVGTLSRWPISLSIKVTRFSKSRRISPVLWSWPNTWIKTHHWKEQTKFGKWANFQTRVVSEPIVRVLHQSMTKCHHFENCNFIRFCMKNGQGLPVQLNLITIAIFKLMALRHT